MSKCYKCGEQWTNENRTETPLLCPKCELAAPTGSAWMTGQPPHSKPGTLADHFLCIRIESDVPIVLVYIHAEKQWTQGGDDTQKVRWWMIIPPMPNEKLTHGPNNPTL